MTNLWIDDIRTPPAGEDWLWVKTSQGAIDALAAKRKAGESFDQVSFDHDLGHLYPPTTLPDGTEVHTDRPDETRRVLTWMIESLEPYRWPDVIRVHSANPVGRKWLLGTANTYAPEHVQVLG